MLSYKVVFFHFGLKAFATWLQRGKVKVESWSHHYHNVLKSYYSLPVSTTTS